MRAQLIAAFMLLTRLPVGRFALPPAPGDLAKAVWAFPLVGLVVGGIGAAVYDLAYRLGMPPLLAGGWMLGATLALTGALHEDGLADTADGFGGGGTPARKLEIMRDSRIGAYGALAAFLSLILRLGAIASLDRPAVVGTALIVAAALGRAGLIVIVLSLNPARRDGLGAAMTRPPAATAAAGLALAALASVLLFPLGLACIAIVVALAAASATAVLAKRQIGGYTGDVLGAAELVVECVVLSALACMTRG